MPTLQQPQGEAQGFTGKGKGRAKDNDEVSLHYSGDEMEEYLNDEEMEEVDPLIDNGDNDLGTMEFDVDNEVANAAGLTFLRLVLSWTEPSLITAQ